MPKTFHSICCEKRKCCNYLIFIYCMYIKSYKDINLNFVTDVKILMVVPYSRKFSWMPNFAICFLTKRSKMFIVFIVCIHRYGYGLQEKTVTYLAINLVNFYFHVTLNHANMAKIRTCENLLLYCKIFTFVVGIFCVLYFFRKGLHHQKMKD